MLADQLDYVIGVDPHRDLHALAIVDVRTGGVVFEATTVADGEGYLCLLRLADQHAPGRRAFAVQGTGSFGAGLTRFLVRHEEWVLEVGRLRRERQSGKSDALDAIRAARNVLGQTRPARPRAGGEREALRALTAAREGAVTARRAGLCQLRGLLVSAPEPLRAELRSLSRARLLPRLAAVRPEHRQDPELRGTLLALRALARRVRGLTIEERELAGEIEALTRKLAPQLLEQPGVGPLAAAQILISGRTAAGSEAKPRSRDSPAAPRSPPHPDKRSATGSTAAATADSTEHCSPLTLLNFGVGPAFGMVGGLRFRNRAGRDVTEEARLEHPDGPEEFDRMLREMNIKLERAMLRGPSPHEAEELRSAGGWDPTVARKIATERAALEQTQVENLNSSDDGRNWRRTRLRDDTSARHFLIDLNEPTANGLNARNIDFEDAFSPPSEDSDEPSEMRRFTDSMPSSDVFVTIVTEMHRNAERIWKPNDIFDIDALSVGVAYCDAVLCDNDKARMLNVRRVGDRLGTRVTSRLVELPDILAG